MGKFFPYKAIIGSVDSSLRAQPRKVTTRDNRWLREEPRAMVKSSSGPTNQFGHELTNGASGDKEAALRGKRTMDASNWIQKRIEG